MIEFTVVIPFFENDDPARAAAFEFLKARYEPDFPVVVGEGSEPWSKGAAVASALAHVRTEGLVVADADALVADYDLTDSLDAVAGGAAWSMPHLPVVRLTARESQRIYRGKAPYARNGGRRPGPPGGGIVVTTVDAYRTAPIDPKFFGWGGEDISWARALDTLVGPCERFGGLLWHLWHPKTPRRPGNRASSLSERLAGLYLDAAGDPEAMCLLVKNQGSEP